VEGLDRQIDLQPSKLGEKHPGRCELPVVDRGDDAPTVMIAGLARERDNGLTLGTVKVGQIQRVPRCRHGQ